MLTHYLACINISFSTQFKPFILAIFHANNTWTFWSNQCKPGLFLTIPKQAVGCPWAAHSPSISSTLWNRNPRPFPAQKNPYHNLMHKLSHKSPKQSVDYPKRAPKIPTIRSQVLGPIKWPLTASNQPNH